MKQKRVVSPLLIIVYSFTLLTYYCSSYCSNEQNITNYTTLQVPGFLPQDNNAVEQSATLYAYITDKALVAFELLRDDLSKLDSTDYKAFCTAIDDKTRVVDYVSALSFLYDIASRATVITIKENQEDIRTRAYQDLVTYLKDLENGENIISSDQDSSPEITKGSRSSSLCNLSVRNCLKTKDLLVLRNQLVKGSLLLLNRFN